MRKPSLEKTYFDVLDRRDKHHMMTLRASGKERYVHKEIASILENAAFALDGQREALCDALLTKDD